jgi:radical SAM superfamily enzyme YgiQ (UPF0313 family)
MYVPGLRYEGPIYRPPSEAHSLLVQATVGCPHNLCTFCTVYKGSRRVKFRMRPVGEIKEDLDRAHDHLGPTVRTLFFPSGNTIIMKTEDLAEICRYARELFPSLRRITIYASAQYIHRKGLDDMKVLAEAGLSRVHVGLESGDDEILRRTRKGATAEEQIEAGRITKEAGIELNEYVVLGLGGRGRTREHIEGTVRVLNAIDPDVIRLRTFLPKVATPILEEIEAGDLEVLSAHEVLDETHRLISGLEVTSRITSDHYTNYIDVHGILPRDRDRMLATIEKAMNRKESSFRDVYMGTQ